MDIINSFKNIYFKKIFLDCLYFHFKIAYQKLSYLPEMPQLQIGYDIVFLFRGKIHCGQDKSARPLVMPPLDKNIWFATSEPRRSITRFCIAVVEWSISGKGSIEESYTHTHPYNVEKMGRLNCWPSVQPNSIGFYQMSKQTKPI